MTVRDNKRKYTVKENLLVLWFLVFVCLFIGNLSISAQITPNPTPPKKQLTEDEVAHFGDIIDVDIVGGFEYDWRGTLTPDGNLDGLDEFNGPIAALCRNESEIARDVEKALSKTLREPKVVVRIIDRSNRAIVRLDGAVKTPTRFKLMRRVQLRELIVLAGGFTDNVSGEITVFRPGNMNCLRQVSGENGDDLPKDNGSQNLTIKITDLLKGDEASNIQILSGDTLEVAKANPVYVIGAVNSPKPLYSRTEITVSRAVASAGGLTKDADGGKVSIFRRDGADTNIIVTDLFKIKRGESVDTVLKPFDIIDVASKGGGKRKYPPLAANSEKTERDKRELPLRVID